MCHREEEIRNITAKQLILTREYLLMIIPRTEEKCESMTQETTDEGKSCTNRVMASI